MYRIIKLGKREKDIEVPKNMHTKKHTHLMNGKDCRNDDVIIEGEFPITHEMRSEPHRGCKDHADGYSRKIGLQIDVHWSGPCS